MSWHLQTLAKYGDVEEAGGGRGRSRPWQAVSLTYNFESKMNDPEDADAGEALEMSLHDRNNQRLREWWSRLRSYPVKWRRAAFSTFAFTYLTAEEMERLNTDINELLLHYKDRNHLKDRRPAGARPVQVLAYGYPLPASRSGN